MAGGVVASGAVGPTPEQLRAMAVRSGFGGGGGGGVGAGFADEDLGEEYEEGKRVREVGLCDTHIHTHIHTHTHTGVFISLVSACARV